MYRHPFDIWNTCPVRSWRFFILRFLPSLGLTISHLSVAEEVPKDGRHGVGIPLKRTLSDAMYPCSELESLDEQSLHKEKDHLLTATASDYTELQDVINTWLAKHGYPKVTTNKVCLCTL